MTILWILSKTLKNGCFSKIDQSAGNGRNHRNRPEMSPLSTQEHFKINIQLIWIPHSIFFDFEKKSDFLPKNQVEKSKMADFSKNSCPDKIIILLQDTPSWAPQTHMVPILPPHPPSPKSSFDIFENRPQNHIFHNLIRNHLSTYVIT